MTNQPIIQMRDISLSFPGLVVHRDISLDIYAGDSITILGPSGTGKTVLIKMIIGLLRPTSGEVIAFGKSVLDQKEDDLAGLRKKIGILFQGAALFDSLNVYENIAYSLREEGKLQESEIRQIIEEKLELVGLAGVESKYPPQLSGGQKKRIGLARALASSPEVMLFDEPTTGLDPTSIRRIDDLIAKLNNEMGMTCISVTHDIQSARRISKRWVLMHEGEIVADGPAEQLLEENDQVQRFTEGRWTAEK